MPHLADKLAPATPGSVADGLDLGLTDPAGSPVLLDSGPTVVAGGVESGKTNLLAALIGARARCNDTVTWVIDYEGGALPGPYLLPYVAGEVDTPAIDWVAVTDRGAYNLAVAAYETANRRFEAYRHQLADFATGRIAASPQVPDLNIIVNGNVPDNDRDTTRILRKINTIGYPWRVSVTITTPRPDRLLLDGWWPTGRWNAGPSTAILLRPARLNPPVIKNTFNIDLPQDAERLDRPGHGYLLTDAPNHRVLTEVTSSRMYPAHCAAVSAATEMWRPTLDAPSRPDGYAHRRHNPDLCAYLNQLAGN